MIRKIKKIFQELAKLSNHDRLLILPIVYWLTIGILFKHFSSFEFVTKNMGVKGLNAQVKPTEAQTQKIKNLSALFCRVANALPFRTSCLVRAFAISKILKNQKLAYTVFIGVAVDSDKKIKAHAWVRSGNLDVVGYAGAATFKIIGTFGNSGHILSCDSKPNP